MNKLLSLLTATSFLFVASLEALELRTWTNLAGQTIEAEFVRMDGDKVILKGKDGREMAPIPKAKLSKADNDYLAEVVTPGKSIFGEKNKPQTKIPNPAKEMKFDRKTMVKKVPGGLEIPDLLFQADESAHFMVFYEYKGEADDLIETAERCWADMNFFHPTFAQKFQDRKMPLFLVDSDQSFMKIAKWYADNIQKSGIPNATDEAARIERIWREVSGAGLQMPKELAEKHLLLDRAQVLKSYRKEGNRMEKIKGAFNPMRVNTLAGLLLDFQASGGGGQGTDAGWGAISVGHAYYKELSITGKSETIFASGNAGSDGKVHMSAIYPNDWPGNLKKALRKEKDLEKNLTIPFLYQLKGGDGNPAVNAIMYSWAFYLQSTPEKIKVYEDVISKVDASHQVPVPDDLAKMYGFADAKAMEADWVKWINSNDFKQQ